MYAKYWRRRKSETVNHSPSYSIYPPWAAPRFQSAQSKPFGWTGCLISCRAYLLRSQKSASLLELGELADELHNMNHPGPAHYSINAGHMPAPVSSSHQPIVVECLNVAVNNLQLEVSNLRHDINALKSARNRSDRRDRSSSGTRNSSGNRVPDGLCWYHKKHGDKADHCTIPCLWKGAIITKGNSRNNQIV